MSLFHERLLKLRDESGKTQSKIAEELGITRQAMSYIVNGREPNYDMLVAIAKYFGVSTDYLVGKSNVRKPENEAVASTLGLTEDSIAVLKDMVAFATGKKNCFMPHVYQERLDAINTLVANENTINIFEEIASYLWHNYEKLPDANDAFIPEDDEAARHAKLLRVKETRSGRNYVFDPDILVRASLITIEEMLTSYRKKFQSQRRE